MVDQRAYHDGRAPAGSQLSPGLIGDIRNRVNGKPAESPFDEKAHPFAVAEPTPPQQPAGDDDPMSLMDAFVNLGGSGHVDDDEDGGISKFQQWWGSPRGQVQRSALSDMMIHFGAAMASLPAVGGDTSRAAQHMVNAGGAMDRAKQRYHTKMFRERIETRIAREMEKPIGERDENLIIELSQSAANVKFGRQHMSLADYMERRKAAAGIPGYDQAQMELAADATWKAMSDADKALLATSAGNSSYLLRNQELGRQYMQYWNATGRAIVDGTPPPKNKAEAAGMVGRALAWIGEKAGVAGTDAGDEADTLAVRSDAEAANFSLGQGNDDEIFGQMTRDGVPGAPSTSQDGPGIAETKEAVRGWIDEATETLKETNKAHKAPKDAPYPFLYDITNPDAWKNLPGL